MKLRHVYLFLCILGILIPYSQFVPWLAENGLDLPSFVSELFSTRIGAFFGLDVLVSAVVLFVFIAEEGRRAAAGTLWLPVIATLACGVSAGFPLFLYLRRQKLDASTESAASRG